MGHRAKSHERCLVCKMHQELCICDAIPKLDVLTRVVLIMHRRECAKTTATGPLALLALPNSELHIHGHREAPLNFESLKDPARRALLLFPDDDVPVLTPEWLRSSTSIPDRPITLVVPDGSWRQAKKMSVRIPGLEHAERVRLPEGPPSAYQLREETRYEGLATFEAIARALGCIESKDVQTQLETLFNLMVKRTLSTRGVK